MREKKRRLFDQSQWPSLWADSIVVSKRMREEEPFKELDWFDDITSIKGEFAYIVDNEAGTVTARNINETSVGELELGTGGDGNCWLDHVCVREDFQLRGIGTEMLRLAVEHLGDFFIPGVQESDDYEFSLSNAGINLINAGLRVGFVSEDQLVFPPDVPLSKKADGDPGLIVGHGKIGDIYTARTRNEMLEP
jgi:GNAT superfamily N-acetyltransferase